MLPAFQALLICVVAAALEGALAGRGVRQRLIELRQPPYAPPLTVWFAIGGIYYVICFVVLLRLLQSGLPTGTHDTALAFLLALMAANAGWGWLFFRRRHLRASFLYFVPYGLIALCLAWLLVLVDRTSFWVLSPYLAYMAYAAGWGRRVWLLNRNDSLS